MVAPSDARFGFYPRKMACSRVYGGRRADQDRRRFLPHWRVVQRLDDEHFGTARLRDPSHDGLRLLELLGAQLVGARVAGGAQVKFVGLAHDAKYAARPLVFVHG